ncbi:outer membrane transport energization protein ExbB [Kushneria sinocarnis]|uniref:Outer membrane transport energization protein ExbB n=1 Tax=Kushneria sinocarnis TaxID=595502 RepID=A0A420WYM3_9GAMM|nr:MotA/TolQ/ExbB proton channel family protein [Kushneria sinocarnis]RKR06334.1 outer membrane transport energization protein ExbB [Kushneria sinocarnis]
MDQVIDPIVRLVEAGGPVLVAIALTAMVMFALGIERLLYWQRRYRHERRALIERWQARHEHVSWSARTLRECWCRELLASLRSPLPWLKLLVALCPLLGLLGTVTGMIQVFDSLSLTGIGQARSMSDGVARATLPTLAGMAVAVVGLLFTSRFEYLVRREDQRLHDRLARAVEDRHA